MFTLDLQSRLALSEQVYSHLRQLITTGVIREGEKLPSVRELSGRLTCSPNTVQKAFSELERGGYVYSSAGLGTFVSPSGVWQSSSNERELSALREAVIAARTAGIGLETIISKASEYYEKPLEGKI